MPSFSVSLFILFVSIVCSAFGQDVYSKDCQLMGVDFQFSVVSSNEHEAQLYLDAAYKEGQRVEQLISSWQATSETSKVNRNAGIKPIKVSKELYNLIKRSLRISELTDGHFDISFASIDKVWYFHKPLEVLPDSAMIRNSVKLINYKDITLNPENQSVFLKHKGMKIGFGAIGKGYVAEKIKRLLKSKGVAAGLINASGDITCWGDHPKTKTWKIGITNPDKTQHDLAWFDIHNSGVVTSGNYENYVWIQGKKYTHIIHPKTGWPVEGLQSVTIFSANAELADALATSVFVMGLDKGMAMINQLNGIECLIVDTHNKIHYSNSLNTKMD